MDHCCGRAKRWRRLLFGDAGQDRLYNTSGFFTDDRALGVDLKDGRLLWSYGRASNDVANVATDRSGKSCFVSSDYGTGAALVEIKDDGTAQGLLHEEMR